MERRPAPTRRAAVVALLVVAALATGCSRNGPVGAAAAITVDGQRISMDKVVAISQANAAYYELQVKAGKDTNGQFAQLIDDANGTGTDTVGMKEVTSTVETLINYEVLRQEAVRLHLTVTAKEIAAARTALGTRIGSEKDLAKLDPALVDFASRFNAYQDAYTSYLAKQADKTKAPPTDAERQAKINQLYVQLVQDEPLCLDVIVTNTKAEATAARARIDGGEDFKAVVADTSIDDQTKAQDGFAGCYTYDQMPTLLGVDLAGASLGDVVGPLLLPKQQAGEPDAWVVSRVHSVTGPTFAEAKALLESQVPTTATPTTPDQVDLGGALDALRKKATVTLDPRLGRWDEATATVVPPAG